MLLISIVLKKILEEQDPHHLNWLNGLNSLVAVLAIYLGATTLKKPQKIFEELLSHRLVF